MNMNTPAFFLAVTSTSFMALFAVVSIMSSRVSRPDVVFAITVNPGFRNSPVGRKILRQFTWWMILTSGLGIALTWLGVRDGAFSILFALGWLSSLGGILSGYVTARGQVAPHRVSPSTQHEAEVRPRDVRLAGGWLGQLGPLLILAGCVIYLLLHWQDIPARFPIHWGLDGQPNGWSTRGRGVFLGPILGALTCLMITGMLLLTAREVRRIHNSGPGRIQEARNLKNVQWLLLGINYWLASLFGALSLMPLFMNGHQSSPTGLLAFSLGGELIIIIVVVFMAMRAGQGGWRLKAAGATVAGTVAVGDRTPDECWKGGLIYWNPDDPAMLVEKRFGYGWTFNFGNARSWWVLVGIIGLSVGISVLAMVLAK